MSEPTASPVAVAEPTQGRLQVTFVPANVWRTGMVVLGVVAFGLVMRFIIDDGGSVIFTVLMSWFAAIAMAPPVNWLAASRPSS